MYSGAGPALHKGPSHHVPVQICTLRMKLSRRWQQSLNKIIVKASLLTNGKGAFFHFPKALYGLEVASGKFRKDSYLFWQQV